MNKSLFLLVFAFWLFFPVAQSQEDPRTRFEAGGQMQKLGTTKGLSAIAASGDDVRLFANDIHTEISVALDPTDADNILVGSNTNSSGVTWIDQGYFYSTDGGSNWSGSTRLRGIWSADPAVAFNADGVAFFNFLSSTGGSTYPLGDVKVYLKKSTNKGASWTDADSVGGGDFDKNHMAIDLNSGSQYKNNIYCAWTDFQGFGSGPAPVRFSRFGAAGTSHSTPVSINGSTYAGNYSFGQGVNLAVGPTGQLYAVWAVYDDWSADYDEDHLGFNCSTDGGQTWLGADTIDALNMQGIRGTLSKGAYSIRVNSFPSMAVDRSGGPWNGTIYIVWTDKRKWDQQQSVLDPDIALIKSTNGGDTWLGAGGERIDQGGLPIRVNDDVLGNGKDQWFPWISVDPYGVVCIVFYDSRNDANNVLTEVMVATSADGGLTFENSPVSDTSFAPRPVLSDYMGDYIGIASSGLKAFPVWMDNRTGTTDFKAYLDPLDNSQPGLLTLAYANKSITGSATAHNNNHLLERGHTGNLHEVFSSGGEIFYRRSTDNGSSWDITNRLSAGNGENSLPSVVAGYYSSGTDYLQVVWQRQLTNYTYQIWGARSSNGGQSWTDAAIVTGCSTVTVTYYQSPAGSGGGPTPVVTSFFRGGYEADPSFLLVYAAQEGLHYRLAYERGSWFAPGNDIIPGSEGDYEEEIEYWSCTNWFPSLGTYNAQGYGAYLSYDDRFSHVYCQAFDCEESPSWNQRQVIDNAGSYNRYSSLAIDNSSKMLGVWSGWNGSRYVIRFRQGTPGGSWNIWDESFEVSNQNSFLPAVTYYKRTSQPVYGVDVIWYASNNAVYQATHDGNQTWNWDGGVALQTNAWIPNLTHEHYNSQAPRQIWTSIASSPYQLSVNAEGIPTAAAPGPVAYLTLDDGGGALSKSSGLASPKRRRAAEIRHTDGSRLSVDWSQPVIGTSGSSSSLAAFKSYDSAEELSPTAHSVFQHMRTKETVLPEDATAISFDLRISASPQDTLAGGVLNSVRETPFKSIVAAFQILDASSGEVMATASAPVQSDAKGLVSYSGEVRIPVERFQGRTVSVVPSIQVEGDFQERDLSFGLSNITVFASAGTEGQALPSLADEQSTQMLLDQNYPNPFNPVTTLRFIIPSPGHVSVRVYDMLGRVVVTLVDNYKQAGEYQVPFNASSLSSGIYIYELKTATSTLRRKMTLLR